MANPENQSTPEQNKNGEVKPDEQTPNAAPTTVQSKEPEDAYLTGGQRNLQRRMLGLNVEGNPSQRPADQSPGLHSTGSFSGVANGEEGADSPKQ